VWVPLEPVPTNTGFAAVSAKAPHPHAALLFFDFLIGDAGQQQYAQNNSLPVRSGVQGDLGPIKDFKRFYGESRIPLDQYSEIYKHWTDLHTEVFVKRSSP
jgi:iron(III) transport system substrate-binding protein